MVLGRDALFVALIVLLVAAVAMTIVLVGIELVISDLGQLLQKAQDPTATLPASPPNQRSPITRALLSESDEGLEMSDFDKMLI
jgi:hypothetical protein